MKKELKSITSNMLSTATIVFVAKADAGSIADKDQTFLQKMVSSLAIDRVLLVLNMLDDFMKKCEKDFLEGQSYSAVTDDLSVWNQFDPEVAEKALLEEWRNSPALLKCTQGLWTPDICTLEACSDLDAMVNRIRAPKHTDQFWQELSRQVHIPTPHWATFLTLLASTILPPTQERIRQESCRLKCECVRMLIYMRLAPPATPRVINDIKQAQRNFFEKFNQVFETRLELLFSKARQKISDEGDLPERLCDFLRENQCDDVEDKNTVETVIEDFLRVQLQQHMIIPLATLLPKSFNESLCCFEKVGPTARQQSQPYSNNFLVDFSLRIAHVLSNSTDGNGYAPMIDETDYVSSKPLGSSNRVNSSASLDNGSQSTEGSSDGLVRALTSTSVLAFQANLFSDSLRAHKKIAHKWLADGATFSVVGAGVFLTISFLFFPVGLVVMIVGSVVAAGGLASKFYRMTGYHLTRKKNVDVVRTYDPSYLRQRWDRLTNDRFLRTCVYNNILTNLRKRIVQEKEAYIRTFSRTLTDLSPSSDFGFRSHNEGFYKQFKEFNFPFAGIAIQCDRIIEEGSTKNRPLSVLFAKRHKLEEGMFPEPALTHFIQRKSVVLPISADYSLKIVQINDVMQLANIFWENAILRTFDHPHILRGHGLSTFDVMVKEDLSSHKAKPKSCAVLMLDRKHCTLERALDEGLLSRTHRERIAREVAEALLHLHCSGCIHKDITPKNILLDKKWKAFVSDFDILSPSTVSHTLKAGTPGYIPPEAQGVLPDVSLTHKHDVYSYGLVLMSLILGVNVTNRLSFEMNRLQVNQRELFDLCHYALPSARPGMREVRRLLETLEPFEESAPPGVVCALSPVDDLEREVCRWWSAEESPIGKDYSLTHSGDLSGFEECKSSPPVGGP